LSNDVIHDSICILIRRLFLKRELFVSGELSYEKKANLKKQNQKKPFPVYQLWIVLKADLPDLAYVRLYEYLTKIIVENGGVISYPQQNGKKLTFFKKTDIRRKQKGKHVSFIFTSSPVALSWIQQFLNLSDYTFRHCIAQK